MSPAARYLAILAAACLALALGYAALFEWQLGAPVAAEYWVRDARIAKLGAARALSGPKIVIVGGSNALLGSTARRSSARPDGPP